MAASEPIENIGRVILGRYRIVELLGRGGMAVVYKAYQESLDRYVAIKLMHGFLAADEEFLRRFQREARNVAALRHPNIVQVHDFDRDGDDYFMVMENIDGPTLKARLEELAQRNQRLPREEAISIVRDLGRALEYAHSRGMVHRDIKPANIMLDSSGRVVLTDFGIAKMVTGTQLTATGSMVGTPAYMAPEQGLGQAGDHRADIYSLGVVLYQLLLGDLPYQADTPLAVILMHVNDPLPEPRAVAPDLPVGLERVLQRALAKVPTERYQSVGEMLDHLDHMDIAATQDIPHSTLVGADAATIRAAASPTVGPTAAASRGQAEATAVPAGASPVPPPVGDTLVATRNRSVWWAVGAGVIVLLFLGILGVFGARGGLLASPTETPTLTATLTATTAPTATETPPVTPTEDVILQLTLQSIERTSTALAAIPTDTPSPDLTQTFAACDFSYAMVSQDPENESRLFVNQPSSVTVELRNTGTCAWEDGNTMLMFEDGTGPPDGESNELAIGAVAPGDTVKVSVPLQTPAQAGQITTTWQLYTGESATRVGDAMTFAFTVIVPATQPPTNTPTPVASPTPAGPTPTVAGPITGANATFHRCDYEDTEYVCLVTIGVGGGTPPFTIVVGADVISCDPGAGVACVLNFRQRRCARADFAIDVTDSTGDTFRGVGGIDPENPNYFVFPPDHKTQCSG